MLGLRYSRPGCIRAAFSVTGTRAGFQKRQRNTLHRFKASHSKSHMDFVAGIWREFLDPYDDSEDGPRHSAGACTCPPCAVASNQPCHKSSGPEFHLEDPPSRTPDLPTRAAGGGAAVLEADDVDMQPAEAGSPEARAWAARVSGSPEDSRMMEEDRAPLLSAVGPPETGRRAQGRARVSRPPPRLGNERDKGPKLSLSKRKLELLLTEPEKSKRKKRRAA